MIYTIPVSPEQEEVIADHLFKGVTLGVVADEKAWMLNHARKKYPGCKILSADLNIPTLEWDLTIEEVKWFTCNHKHVHSIKIVYNALSDGENYGK